MLSYLALNSEFFSHSSDFPSVDFEVPSDDSIFEKSLFCLLSSKLSSEERTSADPEEDFLLRLGVFLDFFDYFEDSSGTLLGFVFCFSSFFDDFLLSFDELRF